MLSTDELRQLRRLQIQLDRRVDSPFAGEYRSAFRGLGMEFEEVRPYQVGDDVRHIDWNVTARAGEPFVKQFREERELTVLLVMDLSGSMRVGTGGQDGRTDKALQQARLAGAIAWAAQRNGDRVGLLSFTDTIEHHLPPRKKRGHAFQVLQAAFASPPPRHRTDLALALQRAHQSLRRRAVVCIFSDFRCTSPYEPVLRLLCSRHRVNSFLVHDPLESALPADLGLIEFEDAETGRCQLIDAAAVQHKEPIATRIRTLSGLGAHATSVSTADDPFHALLQHFRRLERTR
jgi:uncharacterized protein (DUF58 family)